MLFELFTELGVIPCFRQTLHVQVGPVRLPGAVVPADEVPHVHLETEKQTDSYIPSILQMCPC